MTTGLQYADHPAIIRDVAAAEFALHSTEAPAHAGIMYRVDGATIYYWNGSAWAVCDLSQAVNKMATEAGAGITGGTGTVCKSSVIKTGGIIKSSILLDLTGLSSSTTDLDIIGQGTAAAYLGRITAARNGTVLTGRVTCLEVPAGGIDDIDLYAATEGTGVFDGGIAALTETALVTSGGAWTLGAVKVLAAIPAANAYLYLTGGAAGTADVYTAGKFLIELEGYAA